jgi:putative transposase
VSRYQFIDQQRVTYPVRLLCRILGVTPARYYAWGARVASPIQPATVWQAAMVQVFTYHKQRYGTRRLQAELQAQGHRVGRQRLRAELRRRGLRAVQPRAYTPRTTDSTHGLRCAPNRLLDQPKPIQPNQVWVSDITYLPLASGQWAYLCAFQDAYSRQVVGWQVLATMPEELVTSVLRRALLARRPTPGLLVHSDRGGQYCSNAYRQLLYDYHAVRSQSRRGECLDNAQAESLWSRLKTEELEQRDWPVFRDLADAQQSVATYFDYYNYERRHSALAYQTPQTFYVQQLKNTALNCLA